MRAATSAAGWSRRVWIGLMRSAALAMPLATGASWAFDERDSVDEVHVLHIMLRDQSSARALATRLVATPAPQREAAFMQAAKTQSIDGGSAAKGGDLGWVMPGMLIKTFDDVAFATAVGSIGGPLQTPAGWHLLLPLQRRTHRVADLCAAPLQAGGPRTPAADEAGWYRDGGALREMTYLEALLRHIGLHWFALSRESNGDLLFVRLDAMTSERFQKVELHREIASAVLLPSENPPACIRSQRISYRIDCAEQRIAFAGSHAFEGHAAAGMVFQVIDAPDPLNYQKIVAGSVAAAIAREVCKQ